MKQIHIGMDFNIDPMCCVVSEIKDDVVYLFDEIQIFSSNTQELVEEIKSRYSGYNIFIYPDPASKQRKTSAGGITDLSILKNAGFNIRVRNNHPLIRDRINSVNAKLKNAKDVNTLFIDKECKNVIKKFRKANLQRGNGNTRQRKRL